MFFTIGLLDKVKSKLSISRVISIEAMRAKLIHINYLIKNYNSHILG
jgi:hypothetical protein